MPAPQLTTITLALTGTGMAVARAVSALGPVVGVDDDRTRPGLYSRHIQRVPGLTASALGPALRDRLVGFAGRQQHPVVVVPAADDACEWLTQIAPQLPAGIAVSAGYTPQRAGVLLDKWSFGERCRTLHIDIPQTYLPETMDDVRHFAQTVGLPCIVKPRSGHLWRNRLQGQKLLVPQTLDELLRAMDEVVGDPKAVVLQELIPGPESNLGVAAVWMTQQGGVGHTLTARKHRQFPRQFGSGSKVVTEALPQVRALSEQVLQQLDYRGLCGTEFKYDPRHDRWRLIEINPRPTLWYDLCRAAGSNLIAAHVRELAGLQPGHVAPQRDGTVWEYALRDVVALGQSGGIQAVFQAIRTEGLPDTDAVMALDDPGATLAAGAHFVSQAVGHLWPRRKK